MPKELDGLVSSQLVPNMEEFPHGCRPEDWAVKEAWEGKPQPNEYVI